MLSEGLKHYSLPNKLWDADLNKELRRMLICGDRRHFLVSGSNDSLQTFLTQTMLDQEEIFKNQVFELHRLYEIQKILMKEPDLFVTGGESSHSFSAPFSKNLKYESLATEIKFSGIHKVCSSGSARNHYPQEHRGHQRIPLDLELPATHYTDDSDDDILFGSSTPLVSPTTLLTLQRGSGKKICTDKMISSPPLQNILFEGSSFGQDLITNPSCGYATHSGAKHDLETSCGLGSGKNDSFGWISTQSNSLTDLGRPNLLDGKQYPEDQSCKSISTRRKLFASHEVMDLDLNIVPLDESSDHPIDQWNSSTSKSTTSGVTHNEAIDEYGQGTTFTLLDSREPKNNFFALDREDIMNSTLTTSPSKDNSIHTNAEPETCCLEDKACQKRSTVEMNVEKMKNKESNPCSQNLSQELIEGADSNRSHVSCKTNWKWSSPSKFQNSESSLLIVVPSIKMKSHSSDLNKEEVAEVDITVKKGAVSLIYFSSQKFARNQDSTKKGKERCSVYREDSPCSSESYESIVLRQTDCSVDEYCVSSKPCEVASLENKDFGIKVKRGRRMKDFRKEVLPSLASLSRQEICEDIKIMELAIRSREYKKCRRKTSTKSDCFSLVRSRRTRVRNSNRRYYS